MPRKRFQIPLSYVPPEPTQTWLCKGCKMLFKDENYFLTVHKPDECVEIHQRLNNDIDVPPPPTYHELQIENTILRDRILELEKENENLKKQIIVQNTKYIPATTFDVWKRAAFSVQWRHLEKVYEFSLNTAVSMLLKEIAADSGPLPIGVFRDEPKSIFIFIDEQTGWRKAAACEFDDFVDFIVQRFI